MHLVDYLLLLNELSPATSCLLDCIGQRLVNFADFRVYTIEGLLYFQPVVVITHSLWFNVLRGLFAHYLKLNLNPLLQFVAVCWMPLK